MAWNNKFHVTFHRPGQEGWEPDEAEYDSMAETIAVAVAVLEQGEYDKAALFDFTKAKLSLPYYITRSDIMKE